MSLVFLPRSRVTTTFGFEAEGKEAEADEHLILMVTAVLRDSEAIEFYSRMPKSFGRLFIMPVHFNSFFIAISNPDEQKMRLPSGIVEEYMTVVPLECKFSMRYGRTYWVRMEGNAEGVFFDNGWFQFMAFENIKSGYYLWFDRNSLTDFMVSVVEENAVERPLRY
ncbi:B3 domain-containing protein, partial [Striga asiatica]